MKNIIIGNGINIQFGGIEYTNKSIIERAIKNLETNNFSNKVYTKEIEIWIKILYSTLPDFLKGKYDYFAVLKDEKEELQNLKSRYSKSSEISDIGFEDYFLLNELHCRKNKIGNPERYYFQEFLRRLFLDSIYNQGKINEIHLKYPKEFINFLESFDNVFSSNYDMNIELAIKKEILYLHGTFHFLDSVYDPKSFRNKLSDRPMDKTPVIEGYEHVFSTALTGNSGVFKQFAANQPELANAAFNKFIKAMKNNSEIKQQIEEWKNSDNKIVRNLYEAIQLKAENPDLEFTINHALNRLKEITGSITFIGLSPNNDYHIINLVKDNENLDPIEFYFHSKGSCSTVNSLFNNKTVHTKSVKEFWTKITSI